jgi:hypothetical protein
MIDGSRLLNDPNFLSECFIQIVKDLVTSARKRKTINTMSKSSLLAHSKRILLTRSDYQGLDHWAKATLLENLLRYRDDRLEIKSVLQHLETGYHRSFWMPFMEYKQLLERYNFPIVPYPPRAQEAIGGYGNSLRQHFEGIPTEDRKRLLNLKEQLLEVIERIIFEVENGTPMQGECEFFSHNNK